MAAAGRQSPLYPKAASADKLPDHGIVRYQLAAHSQKIVQELEEPLGFCILRRVRRDSKQKRLCVLLKDGQLIEQGQS